MKKEHDLAPYISLLPVRSRAVRVRLCMDDSASREHACIITAEIIMPANKDRLYVCLYRRGCQPKMPEGEDKYVWMFLLSDELCGICRLNGSLRYHWALLIGPKAENLDTRGTRYHAKIPPPIPGAPKWVYEEVDINLILHNLFSSESWSQKSRT